MLVLVGVGVNCLRRFGCGIKVVRAVKNTP